MKAKTLGTQCSSHKVPGHFGVSLGLLAPLSLYGHSLAQLCYNCSLAGKTHHCPELLKSPSSLPPPPPRTPVRPSTFRKHLRV